MTRLARTGGPALVALAALLLSAGCHGSSTSPSAQGSLEVRLTDAAVDGVSQINVYVTGLTVKPAGGAVQRIASDIGLIDLLSLRNTSMLLARVGATPGQYEFIEVDLDQSRSNVVVTAGHLVKPLRIASEMVQVPGGFTIGPTSTTVITLDFDAAASLRLEGNGEYLLVPVIVQAGVTS